MNNIDKELYKNIGLQLKKARENKNISYDTLSELISGIKTKSSLKRYEDGESRIELDTLEIICNKLGLNYLDVVNNAKSSLTKEKLTEIPISQIKFDDYFPLHYYSGLSAGSFEELLEAEPDSIVYVPITFQNKRKRLHAFKINGTSMNNIIADGSIVVTEDTHNNAIPISDGDVAVVFYNGEATVKKVYNQEDRILLMPDSTDKAHLPITIVKDDTEIYIIGKVIWHMNPDDISKVY